MWAQIGTLILATSLVQLANGFFTTFVSLRVAVAGFDPAMAGLVLSSYFAGFTIGALKTGSIIESVGYIRAYAAFAGLVTIGTAAMPLFPDGLSWIVARALVGFGCSGLFVATESWLNAKALPAQRGHIFSLYMVGTFVALACGQLAIAQADMASSGAFNVIIALFAVALVMVSTTRVEAPAATKAAPFSYWQLIRLAPLAVIGGAAAGFIKSQFYALVPAWLQDEGAGQSTIALFMLVAVLGGLAFQVPVGRLSDRFDRRLVLAGLGVGVILSALILVLVPRSLVLALPAGALLGGFMSTLYPVCVALAHDKAPADRVVAVSGRLILTSGLGSIAGPIIGASAKSYLGIDGVLYLMAGAGALVAGLAGLRVMTSPSPAHFDRSYRILEAGIAPLDDRPGERESMARS
jgi:MFS family permease